MGIVSKGAPCNVESAKTMTPIGTFVDLADELKNVKPGDVLRLYEETT